MVEYIHFGDVSLPRIKPNKLEVCNAAAHSLGT